MATFCNNDDCNQTSELTIVKEGRYAAEKSSQNTETKHVKYPNLVCYLKSCRGVSRVKRPGRCSHLNLRQKRRLDLSIERPFCDLAIAWRANSVNF